MGRRSSQGIASIPRLLAATLSVAALLAGLAGCAGPTNGTQTASPASGDHGSSAQGQDSPQQGPVSTLREADGNGRLASSLSAYIDEVLADPYVSDYERPFLEQAKKEGRVSTAVYEKVWSDYKTCMVDHGFPEPKLERFPNGMMDIMQHAVGTDEQEERWRDAYADCYLRFSHVQGLYGQQQGNPSLYANVDEAVVDCMRREGVVPPSYTVKDFNDGQTLLQTEGWTDAKDKLGYDFGDARVRGCKAAQGWSSSSANDPVEYLW
ncbi:hypothetical protein CPA40_07140 [Bifidobacterium callitrichos]|uniref:Lipoprotein n=1 Tax=Bifidobacterium callitrichos TaxID=762209 RepID=A0A2T3G9R1_9BIFI|nr:hypothetical protein [Bifidobacterium callitrichos]PST46208.1 hypothetical protein CPA40_07140 [Bifidobacterium callitrichos]